MLVLMNEARERGSLSPQPHDIKAFSRFEIEKGGLLPPSINLEGEKSIALSSRDWPGV